MLEKNTRITPYAAMTYEKHGKILLTGFNTVRARKHMPNTPPEEKNAPLTPPLHSS